jgi:acetoin utilization deacetylase AcuC-like enzyme
MRPAFIWSPSYEIDIGRHVFPTSKFRLLKEGLVERGWMAAEDVLPSPRASDAELLNALTPEYLRDLVAAVRTPSVGRSELPINRTIIESMRHTAGGTLLAARTALRTGAAFHLGGGYHHGFADHAEGFCYINDIAVAAATLLHEAAVQRVCVIDTDVHQGNGTAAIFRRVPEVFTFSIHQEDLYPRDKETSDLDIGLEAHPGAALYLSELQRGVAVALDLQRPDLVFYAAGVDPFEEDQLGSLGLSFETMRIRDRVVFEACLSRRIPFVTVVAGGYARNLADTVGLHVQTVEEGLRLLGLNGGERRSPSSRG